MTIKTFRGLMTNDSMDTISLHTNNGSTGYRIVKFQVFPYDDTATESTVQVFSVAPTTIVNTADFSDPTLLAAIYFSAGGSQLYSENTTVVIDNAIVNQDIYVTLKGHNVAASLNYYIELEQIKLALDESTVATLQNIREHTPYNNPT